MTQEADQSTAAQLSIRNRVIELGSRLDALRPGAVVAVLAGAALWPVAVPLLGGGAVVGVASGVMGLLSGPGQRFVSDFLERIQRSGRRQSAPGAELEVRAQFERALLERMEADSEEAAALREDIGALLRRVDGVEVALAAAEQGTREALARGLAEVGESWREFGWMLSEVHSVLLDVQARQAEALAMQRLQIDMQREQLVKTNLLLRTRGDPPERPVPASRTRQRRGPPAQVSPPYKGLPAYAPEDAPLFFGRDTLRAQLLARLAETRLLCLVGDSGSGKSSLLHAGLVPAIWSGALPGSTDWPVALVTPGPRPLEALSLRISQLRGIAPASLLGELRDDAGALTLAARQVLLDTPAHARLVVVVDQLEEIFTVCENQRERETFVDALLQAAARSDAATTVVVAIRSEFLGRLAAHPGVPEALRDNQVLVGPLRKHELVEIIERPAAHVGLTAEPGLVSVVVADAGGEPAILPLVSHALLETFRRRRDRALTAEAYLEAGGIRGAISQTAEETLRGLTATEREVAREVFLRLVVVNDVAEATRRRVPRDRLLPARSPPEVVNRVIDVLVDARLLTSTEDAVEIAHEALIRHWHTLRQWLDEDREGMRLHQRLAAAAEEWQSLGHDPSATYRGVRLAAAVEWSAARNQPLNRLERQFLEASLEVERTELKAARRRGVRRRAIAVTLAGLVFAAVGLLIFAMAESRRATDQQRTATSRRLAAEATASKSTDPDLSLLLSLEAYRRAPTVEARSALVAALEEVPRLRLTLRGSRMGAILRSVAFGGPGPLVAFGGDDGWVRLWDAARRRRVSAPLQVGGKVQSISLSRDARWLAAATGKAIGLWELTPDGVRLRARRPSSATDIALADGPPSLAAGGNHGVVDVLGVPALEPERPALRDHTGPVGAVAIQPDGTRLVSGGLQDGRTLIWDVARGRVLHSLTDGGGSVGDVAISRDGSRVLSAGSAGLLLWNGPSRAAVVRPMQRPYGVAFDPTGSRVATANGDGTIRLLRARDLTPVIPAMRSNGQSSFSVSFAPDGSAIASTAADGSLRLWDVARPVAPAIATASGTRRAVTSVLSAAGGVVATGTDDGSVSLFETFGARRAQGTSRAGRRVVDLALSANGRRMASAAHDGELAVWDVDRNGMVRRATRRVPVKAPVIALSGGGRTIAWSGFEARGVRLWDVDRGRATTTLPHSDEAIRVVAFREDGHLLAAGGEDGAVSLWDVRSRRKLARLDAPGEAPIDAIAWSPGGRTLVAADHDGIIRWWDVGRQRSTGGPLQAGSSVTALAFSGNGRTLASASGRVLRLWDVTARRALGAPLHGHESRIDSIAFGADGSLRSADASGNVVGWDPLLSSEDPRAWRHRVCWMVGRALTRSEWSAVMPADDYRPACRPADLPRP